MIAASLAICIVMPVALTHSGLPEYLKPLYHLADFVAGILTARVFVLLESRSWPHSRGKRLGEWVYWPAATAAVWFILHPRVLWGVRADLNSVLRPLNVLLLLGFALSGGWLARLLSTQRAEYLGKA